MTLEQIRELIDTHVQLIKVDAKAVSEARDRAAKFLTIQAVLSNYLLELDTDRAKIVTMTEALYAKAARQSSGKSITEKKLEADEDSDYTDAKIGADTMAAQVNWVKQYIKIFENAHLMFRQLSRD